MYNIMKRPTITTASIFGAPPSNITVYYVDDRRQLADGVSSLYHSHKHLIDKWTFFTLKQD